MYIIYACAFIISKYKHKETFLLSKVARNSEVHFSYVRNCRAYVKVFDIIECCWVFPLKPHWFECCGAMQHKYTSGLFTSVTMTCYHNCDQWKLRVYVSTKIIFSWLTMTLNANGGS